RRAPRRASQNAAPDRPRSKASRRRWNRAPRRAAAAPGAPQRDSRRAAPAPDPPSRQGPIAAPRNPSEIQARAHGAYGEAREPIQPGAVAEDTVQHRPDEVRPFDAVEERLVDGDRDGLA